MVPFFTKGHRSQELCWFVSWKPINMIDYVDKLQKKNAGLSQVMQRRIQDLVAPIPETSCH